jgi:hypothetical protein
MTWRKLCVHPAQYEAAGWTARRSSPFMSTGLQRAFQPHLLLTICPQSMLSRIAHSALNNALKRRSTRQLAGRLDGVGGPLACYQHHLAFQPPSKAAAGPCQYTTHKRQICCCSSTSHGTP